VTTIVVPTQGPELDDRAARSLLAVLLDISERDDPPAEGVPGYEVGGAQRTGSGVAGIGAATLSMTGATSARSGPEGRRESGAVDPAAHERVIAIVVDHRTGAWHEIRQPTSSDLAHLHELDAYGPPLE
jgi:hypothetical protein